ncbi:hypothetical protein DSM106972_094760 [Dulcicalothrix desertica PCC 7102]|uniref:Filamentous haemagglutinin FhaB/tRNA nuclease CdiA-like TPS domain-containing protein n=1 Tax=Dulcicalothrix desertica PCC 7102 TaxID=232991 RepID=A0A433UJI2_9CYAN|nr:hypothetical protein DSM106972_094760 [Dulcicalothrix desertica PCC 7102]
MGNEASRLTPNKIINGAPADHIDGGAQRGINLFHSFSQFNIGDGQRVYFGNPVGVQNILTRVTGAGASNILGTLGVDGAANLFLINPNGILFGQNASLDVRGSFVGTTANGVKFGDFGVFDASDKQAPALLTVNPSALLFNQINSNAAIQNNSVAPVDVNMSGLRVPDGKSLLLVGGSVLINGGGIFARSGNVELAGLAAPGNIGLNIAGDNFSLTIPDNIDRANISLSNNAEVNVRGSNNGSVKIDGRDVNLTQGSKIRAGIDIGLGTPSSQGGNIIINATEATTLTDGSFIANILQETAFGKTGNINIATKTLTLSNGGFINASNFGTGNTGNVNINASGAVLITGQKDDLASGISNSVLTGAIGNSGNINIKSGSFTLSNEAFLATGSFGQGNSGNISLQVLAGVELSHGFIYNNIGESGIGNGGKISINAMKLSLTDSSQIQSRVEASNNTSISGGQGNAGDININVQGDINFFKPRLGETNGIVSQVDAGTIGNGANVTINAGSLSILDGSEIQGSTRGKGNSGNITINAKDNILLDGTNGNTFSRIINSVQINGEGNAGDIQIATRTLNVKNGAFITNSNTFGKGDAGNIIIYAHETINLDTLVRINSDISRNAVGNGGEISIKTGTLNLNNGSEISSDMSGEGLAGNIMIEARDSVLLDGVFSDAGKFFGNNLDFDGITAISSDLLEGVGKAGNIQIITPSLLVSNGAQISSNSSARGDGGNITITANNNVSFIGFGGRENYSSQVSSVIAGGIGNGGDIRINAGDLLVKDGGAIKTNNSGEGNGGNIFMNVRDTITFDSIGGRGLPSRTDTFAINGNAGNIYVNTGSLFLTNGGKMSSLLLESKGNAGNIVINARNTVKLDGQVKDVNIFDGNVINVIDVSSGLTTALLDGEGSGGNIEITTGSLEVSNGAEITSNTSGRGNAGNIIINARSGVTFDGGKDGLFTAATSSTLDNTGNGGDIRLTANSLFLKNGAFLGAASSGNGSAGNIFIDTHDVVVLDGSGSKNLPSQATTFASGTGNGGNIEIKTGTLRLTNSGQISTFAKTNAGSIDIYTRDAVIADGIDKNNIQSGAFSDLLSGGVGKGGNIRVTTNSFTLSNGGQFRASSFGTGNAGNILINARDTVSVKGAVSNAVISGVFTTLEEQAQGRGGNIDINTGSLFMNGSGRISTSTLATGNAGDITVNARETINLDGKGRGNQIGGILSSAFTGASGNAGNTDIKAKLVRISNSSGIAAVTTSGTGGNIILNIDENLVLRTGGFISTTAGIQQAGGDGGNITINTPFIVADKRENSDITANAFTGRGGNVVIRTQGIFGIEPRVTESTETSDITASSQLGVQGEISITEPQVQPAQGLIELPEQVVDATRQVAQICPRQPGAKPLGEFTITGRGSLPPSPLEPMTGTTTTRALATLQQNVTIQAPVSLVKNSPTPQIVEAQGWVKTGDDGIELVATAPVVTPNSIKTSTNCPVVQ